MLVLMSFSAKYVVKILAAFLLAFCVDSGTAFFLLLFKSSGENAANLLFTPGLGSLAWQSADAIVYSECGCPSDSPLTTAVAHAQLLTNRIQGVSRAAKGVIQEIPCQLFLVIIQW